MRRKPVQRTGRCAALAAGPERSFGASCRKWVQIISALIEINSLRAMARMNDVAFNTVLKLLPQIGKACAEYQDRF